MSQQQEQQEQPQQQSADESTLENSDSISNNKTPAEPPATTTTITGTKVTMKGTKAQSKQKNKETKKKKKETATLIETFGFVYRCGWQTRLLFVTGTVGGLLHGLSLPMVAYFLSQTFETMSRISDDAVRATHDGIDNNYTAINNMRMTIDSSNDMAITDDPMDEIRMISYTFLLLGVYTLVTAFLETASFEYMAAKATVLFQSEWFEALLRQDSAYYDIYSSANNAPTSILRYRQGLGRPFGVLIQSISTGFAGVCLGLFSSWKVTLLVFAILPLISISSLNLMRLNQGKTKRSNDCYQQANTTAYSTVSNIRTVLSLNALPTMIANYQQATQHALEIATQHLVQMGFSSGGMMASFMCLNVGVILFGCYVMYSDVLDTGCNPAGGNFGCEVTGADIFGTMLGILFAGQALSQIGNSLEALTDARVAAKDALSVMERIEGTPAKALYKKPQPESKQPNEESNPNKADAAAADEEAAVDTTIHTITAPSNSSSEEISAVLPEYQINPFATGGIIAAQVQGAIEFKDVTFAYPSRPSAPILQNFSLKIPAGKTVALVGPSGGGKSTVLSLIERFYDPILGQVCLDGIDIKDLNLTHYRNSLGYVGQEPTLFATTIRNNIAYGINGKGEDVSQDQIEQAAKMANAHDDFIVSLPDGYDTQVGDKGAQLSGGQKQRIAIARVLIGQPRILCLDEATSALDAESELHVQEALDNILTDSHGSMTAVIVAHRLSTIRNADLIYVIAGGGVVESGTHEELMKSDAGHYRQLVEKQEGKQQQSPPQDDEADIAATTTTSTSGPLSRSSSSVDEQESSELSPPPPKSTPPTAPVVALDHQTPLLQSRDVGFCYPSRPNKQILKKFNLSVRAGETLALVGPSGGGKSTTVGLIERFYDPNDGVLEYKGHDVKTLNAAWYRDQIGYVGQEPCLFPGTIGENIAFGAPHASQEMIEEAAKQANIHDFVMSTPDKYNTLVGESGKQLSGGQKQRVAIARALIKKPPILLLDEATSALDNESEAIVQEALDKLMSSHEHTVIVIAHKLSTIRSCADRIAVVGGGEVLEIGSHDKLIAKTRGHYKRLVEAQKRQTSLDALGRSEGLTSTKEEEDDDDDDETAKDNTDQKEKNDDEAGEESSDKTSLARRVKDMAKPDFGYIAVGSIGAVLAGAAYPMLGLLFAESINLFFYQVAPCSDDRISALLGFDTCEEYWDDAAEEMQSKSFQVSSYYAILMSTTLLGSAIVFWGFGKASERLSKRIRDSVFTSLVRQEPGFFDVRSIGELTTQLQQNTARMHAFSGTPIRNFLVAFSSAMIGLLLSFSVMWPYAILCFACMIPMVFAAKLRQDKDLGKDKGGDEVNYTTSSGAIMVETLLNIKTVAALGLERQRKDAYNAAVIESQKNAKRECAWTGLMSGLGHFIQRLSNAVLYFWGGWLLFNYPEHFGFEDFLVSQFAFIFATLGLAAAMQDVDDNGEVEGSARWIFSILDRKSLIDPLSEEGLKLDQPEPKEVKEQVLDFNC